VCCNIAIHAPADLGEFFSWNRIFFIAACGRYSPA
jgi:hypothetical protein